MLTAGAHPRWLSPAGQASPRDGKLTTVDVLRKEMHDYTCEVEEQEVEREVYASGFGSAHDLGIPSPCLLSPPRDVIGNRELCISVW